MSKVKATIIKIEGDKNAICDFGHKVGDIFIFNEMGPDTVTVTDFGCS